MSDLESKSRATANGGLNLAAAVRHRQTQPLLPKEPAVPDTRTTIPERLLRVSPVLTGLALLLLASVAGDILAGALGSTAIGAPRRFGLLGSTAAAAPQVLVAVALLLVAGWLADSRGILRLAAVVALAYGIIAIVIAPLFALDWLQVRRTVPQDRVRGFDLSSGKTVVFSVATGLALVWSGVRGWLASPEAKSARREVGEGLVVGRD